MKTVSGLFIVGSLFFGACSSGRYVVQTATGFDSPIKMGELPINVKVEKSIAVKGELFLDLFITIDMSESIGDVAAHKFVDGNEVLIGNTDKYGKLKIRTRFSSPDTFSFTSPSYRKQYLYVGTRLP